MWVQATVISNITGNGINVSAPSEVAVEAILGAVKKHLLSALPSAPTNYPLGNITITELVTWE